MASLMFSSPAKPHFFKPILPGFNTDILIPEAFYSNYIKGRLMGNEAELRSDASEISWKIKMQVRRLTKGWEEFYVAHNLQVGDVLVFRHEGNLLFHVTLFGLSCCEITYSKKDESNVNNKTRKKAKNEFPSVDTDYVVPVSASNQQRDTVCLRRGFTTSSGLSKDCSEIIVIDEKGRSSVLDLRYYKRSNRFGISQGWRDFCNKNEYKTGCFLRLELVRNGKTPVFKIIPLKIDEDNIGNHLEKNEQKVEHESVEEDKNVETLSLSYNPSFMVSVTASTLGQDKLNLPVRLSRANILDERLQEISLINKMGKTWRLNLKYSKSDGRFYITHGWRSFCEANGQKAGSTFLLKLVTNRTAPMLLMISEDSVINSSV